MPSAYNNSWDIPLHIDLNELPDLEVDRQLARFIGWKPSQIRVTAMYGVQVGFKPRTSAFSTPEPFWWRGFSHKSDEVMWRICSKNGVFPLRILSLEDANIYAWSCSSLTKKYTEFASTPNRAAANLFLDLMRRKDRGQL